MNSDNIHEFKLEDLPADRIYVDLDEKFRKFLFDRSLKNSNDSINELANRLSLSNKYLLDLKKGIKRKDKEKNIRLELLNKLLSIAKIEFSEIKNNIKYLRFGRNGYNIPNIFPLKFDSRLAALIGHATGDGHIKNDTFNFQYRNSSDELIKKVCNLIFAIFDIKCKVYVAKDGTKQVEAPSIVGYILHKAGAPVGSKIKSRFNVPFWIKEDDKSIISSYLGALVDDEFCISQYKVIYFGLGKNIELKNNLYCLFVSISYLFLRLNIKSSVRRTNKFFVRKDGVKTTVMELTICGQNNFMKFKDNVVITNKSKITSLNQLISSYISKPYEKCHYKRAKDIALNKLKLGNFTTTQLTKESTITRCCFLRHLTKMKKDGLIREVKRLAYGEILWELKQQMV